MYKNLRMELDAKRTWKFTDEIKERIWKGFEWDDEIKKDDRPFFNIQAQPIFEAYENVVKTHRFDYLDSYYIQLKFAYNFWKQYEAEWNRKYRSNK